MEVADSFNETSFRVPKLSCVEQKHNTSVSVIDDCVPRAGVQEVVVALDHDFSAANITPSVKLFVDTPGGEDPLRPGLYYNGQAFVVLKDATLQPSTAMRHAAETLAAIRAQGRENIRVLFVKTLARESCVCARSGTPGA